MNWVKRYQKSKLLGKGGMGEVWQVHDQQLDCDWAMKELSPDADVLARRAFAAEIAILTKLNHPGIPRIVDKAPDACAVIMDLVTGMPLIGYREAVDEAKLIDWGEQLLHILAHIHERGILYLDCKPANIMIDQNGQLHLIDFGTARFKDRQCGEDPHYGTIGFAPPEQYEPQLLDERCDIYAFGKTMIALALGQPAGSLLAHCTGEDTKLSAGMRMIIGGCIQADAQCRYPNIALLLEDWQHLGKVHQEIGVRQKRMRCLMGLCIFIGTACYLLALLQFRQVQRNQADRFVKAMQEADYPLAIRLKRDCQDPYEQLYEKVFADVLHKQTIRSSYVDALQQARKSAIAAMQEYDLDLAICDDEFLYRLARDALLTKDETLLDFVEAAVNHMGPTNLRSLLEQLCQWRSDPLFITSKMPERAATWLAIAKQDEHFIELGLLAAQLYEWHSLTLDGEGYAHWQLWMDQLDTYRHKQDQVRMDEENLRLFYRLRADCYYQYGRFLKNSKNIADAAEMFLRLREVEQEMQKEGLADEQILYECGNACLYLFQEGEKQMEQVALLDQAKAYYEAALAVKSDYPQAKQGWDDCERLRAYWERGK